MKVNDLEETYKDKLIRFIETNIVDKVINSKNATLGDKRQAMRVIRDLHNKKLNVMSIVMYYYHCIINRTDVKEAKNKRLLETFERSLPNFEKELRKIGKALKG